MKALILSGGKGTRLRPITHTSAKQLVPVANKPILFYGIESIVECGITDIGFVVGETRAEIENAVGDGSKWGARATYIPQEAPLGLAHAVKIARDFIGGEPFVMYLGDNLIKDGIKPLVSEFISEKPTAQILLAEVGNPGQFGVAELENGKVVMLEEKPASPKSNLALVGVYMFSSAIFEAVNAIKPSPRGELEITDAIQYLIDKGADVRPHIIKGWWKDTGKLEDMLEANRIILSTKKRSVRGAVDSSSTLDGAVIIEDGASIENSAVRGPAVIGHRSRIINSYVGPYTSVYHDVVVENSEVEHSIILENSRVRDVKRLEDSLIGQNVEISRTLKKPAAYRIMVGDSSKVEIL